MTRAHWMTATRVWLAWLAMSSAAFAQVSVTMQASATDVRVDDTFQLQISIESESLQNPDVSLPNLDAFVVVQRQVSRPMSFSFSFGGRQQVAKSTTHYVFVLQPTRQGKFKLSPAEARVGNQRFVSAPLTINVHGGTAPPGQQVIDPDAAPSDPNAPQADNGAAKASGPIADAAQIDEVAFIRAVADKSEPYVGEQVTVTFYLYLRGNAQVQPTVETQPTTDGFWIHDLIAPGSQTAMHRQVVKGLTYTAVTLRRFAAFPLREGELTIGPMSVSIDQSSVFDLFAGRAPATLRREGQPLVLHAKPLPEAGKPSGRGANSGDVAIGRFTVTAKLDRNQVATGDAVTLSATVQGSGNIRAVTLPSPSVDGLRVLEPQVRDVVEAPGDLAGGIRTYEWLVVPERPGTFTIAPLQLAVFDTQSGQYSTVQSDALTLVAAGAAKASVVGDREPTEPSEADVATEATEELAPIRTHSHLARKQTRLIDSVGYRIALLVAPLAWLLWVIVAAWRARWTARQSLPNADRMLKQARKRLDEASRTAEASALYAALSQAITEAVQARLDQPIGGYTRPALGALLRERGMDEALSARVINFLSRCELGRFSSLAQSRPELDDALNEGRLCFEAIARFEPTATGGV